MRRYCLTSLALVVAFVLLLQIGCQEQAKAPGEPGATIAMAEPRSSEEERQTVPSADKPGPKITFEKVVHEFGDVTARRKHTTEFKFTNTGDELLRITEVKGCCGVAPKLVKREFAPGEGAALEVEYLSGPTASAVRRIIYVSSNDESNPKVALTLTARVVPKVAYEPQKLNLVYNEENAGCPNITLTSLDNQPFSIKTFHSTGGTITADVDPSVEATKFVLQPEVDYEKLQSRSVGFISIDLTHPECNRITLSFNTLMRFEFQPPSIMAFVREPQKPMVKKVSVVSNYGEDFEVVSTSSRNGLAKVVGQRKTAKGYEFEVEVTPPAPDDTGKFDDVLYVQLKDDQRLAIKCYGGYLNR